MKTVIPEGMASIYDIAVPLSFDIRKLKKQLDAELEKRHPCFPERCAVDYRIRRHADGDEKAGLHVRAVVMDRFQLADLKKRNTGCALYIGEHHPYLVFSHEIRRKRLLLAAAAVLSVIAVCAAFYVISVRSRNAAVPDFPENADQTALSEAAAPVAAVSETVLSEEQTAVSGNIPEQKDFAFFFRDVYEKNGRFSSFSWNGESRVLSVLAEGLFPEQMQDAAASYGTVSLGPVSYRDAVPVFECTFKVAPSDEGVSSLQMFELIRGQNTISVSLRLYDTPDACIPQLRNLLLENAGSLSSETVNPPSLSGVVPDAEWASFARSLTMLLGLSDEEGQPVTEALHTVLPLSDFVPLFYDAPGLPFAASPDEPDVPGMQEEAVPAYSKSDEIGHITREDGSHVVFYHDKEGKIEQKILED